MREHGNGLRVRLEADALLIMCIGCGIEGRIADPRWMSLPELARVSNDAIAHLPTCGRTHAPADGRIAPPAPQRIHAFVSECMVLEDGAYVSMEDLRAAYDGWPGNELAYADYTTFGKWIRQAIPAGARVVRKRLDGERQNWIMGMRLR
jgi:hypothetical protein